MTPEEIVLEIRGLQQDVQSKSVRIQGLSQALYRRVRKAPVDDDTSVYITYANAWTRFAGMVQQGVTRTTHTARVLKRLTPKVETAAKAVPKLVRKEEPQTPMESLLSLYADENEDEAESSPSEVVSISDEDEEDSEN